MSVRVRYSDELYHHGVPGQKHGVRKYQNEDGSLTPLGRIHYGVGQARSAAAAGVTKVKRAASAGANKVGTGVKNAASATGNFVKTNAPVAAKATGRVIGSAAKATGNAAWKGTKYVTSGQMQRDRTKRLNDRANYRNAKAADIKSKYAKRYAKQQAKEDRYMAKMRYKEEKKKHTIIGKAKSALNSVADISGKLAPLGTAALMVWLGGGFKDISGASNSLENASKVFRGGNVDGGLDLEKVLFGGTREAQSYVNRMFKSTAMANGGKLSPEYVKAFRQMYPTINEDFISAAARKYVR